VLVGLIVTPSGTVPTLPTRFVTGPDTRLELGGTVFELKHAHGGHTPGDTLVWLPQKILLFTGDTRRGVATATGQPDLSGDGARIAPTPIQIHPWPSSNLTITLQFLYKEALMDIKVLDTGCANCKNTIALIDQMAREKGVAITLRRVEELRDIMVFGVMSTPGVVINGKVVHVGGVPSRGKVEQWLAGH
jgi:hypothetical protein